MDFIDIPPRRPIALDRDPTLLVFTLGASWEARRRNLLPERWRRAEQALHRTCFDEVLAAGRASGFRLKVSSPAQTLPVPSDVERLPQSGRDFGTRLRRAWGAAQESQAITVLVGSDVPGLRERHLRQALETLTEDPKRVVVGPSQDGGFYLLASAQPLDHVLASLRWCSRHTLSSLREALAREGLAVTELEPLCDLDRRSDLEAWIAKRFEDAHKAWQDLLLWLITAWKAWRQPLQLVSVPIPSSAARATPRGRAPPRSTGLS